MYIYKITWNDPSDGDCIAWAKNKAAATAAIVEVRDTYKGEWLSNADIACQRIDVPTTRAALTDWLNRNFQRDNG